MKYAEYSLTDLGYHLAALDGPGEIFGLDNRVVDEDGFEDDQRFWHLGVTGHPEGAALILERPDKSRCLAVFADGVTLPPGGTEILAAEVVDLLEAEYGWPQGTRLVDGLPTGPEANT
ncbi:MAG: hypothetical protein CVU73_11155 [Deltaproteobacteria bacterium HGW-Deltaproteobacteria-8]|jgi:hypothetical protein|nr:MAG: hypothetical protein CVU73_11155 [Deltaproteobacteria bacterium HGW-Deltaproteobacteria-8]